MAVSLREGLAQKQLAHNKHGIIGRPLFLHQKMDVLCKQWECKGFRQIFTQNENLMRQNFMLSKGSGKCHARGR